LKGIIMNNLKTDGADKNKSLKSYYVQNKLFLIIASVMIILTLFGYAIHTYSRKTQNSEAWNTIAEFESLLYSATVSDKEISSYKSNIEGTEAEPWFLFSLSHYYLMENRLINAKEILRILEQDFSSHYIFKNTKLAPVYINFVDKELSWSKGS